MKLRYPILLALLFSSCTFDTGSGGATGDGGQDTIDAIAVNDAAIAVNDADVVVDAAVVDAPVVDAPDAVDAALVPDADADPILFSDGLVVRYFLDDAPDTSLIAIDSSGVPPLLNLDVAFDTGDEFTTINSNRGLHFAMVTTPIDPSQASSKLFV